MFARWIRKTIGGIRLFLTLAAMLICLAVIGLDVAGFKLSREGYALLGAMLAQAVIFVWQDSRRPTDEVELFRQPARPKTGFIKDGEDEAE